MKTHIPTLDFSGHQSRTQSVLISLGLFYLAIPNLLFLWGWFVPWLAIAVTLLILFAVTRAVVLTSQDNEKWLWPGMKTLPALLIGLSVASLVSLYYLFRAGLLGCVQSYGDLEILRNAMFANLRDAAWPVILPNGKEMSYYLANVLPPALMARLMPHSGQWSVVLWTLPAMLLFIAMAATLVPGRRTWGWKFALAALFLAVFYCPFVASSVTHPLFHGFEKLTGCDIGILRAGRPVVCGHSLSGCGGAYNSSPPSLLLTGILLTCKRRQEVVLPVALSLLVPLSPFGGVDLMPLVALRWWMGMREKGRLRLPSLLVDALLPMAMMFICAMYFTRADGTSAVSLTPTAWGWFVYLRYEVWRMGGWLLLLLPLWFCLRRDTFFLCFTGCYLLMNFLFIGSMPEPGAGANNELWLKTAPCYMFITACYWMRAWHSMGWYKYLITAACLLMTVRGVYSYTSTIGQNAWLQVNDRWNGHLNHGDDFLNQSIPRCKEPLVPGVMLRTGGESEKTFPGNLLPPAPGCDYSRPANAPGRLNW